jgi:hypothetical protein
MILQLSSKWKKYLVSLPETGMGYQIVDIRLRSGTLITRLTVNNCSELVIPDKLESFDVEDISEIHLSEKTGGGLTRRSS